MIRGETQARDIPLPVVREASAFAYSTKQQLRGGLLPRCPPPPAQWTAVRLPDDPGLLAEALETVQARPVACSRDWGADE